MGDKRALAIYKALLRHTLDVALKVKTDKFLFYNNFIDENDDWPNADFQKHLQIGKDLGEKMKKAFQQAFIKHQKVLIIGSDCPTLTSSIVNKAFEKLETFPFVVGPATDGGYYLLGMNHFYPEVFENIEWSTPQVFPKTTENIKNLGKTCYLLPELSDIDNEQDWIKYGWKI